MQWQVQVQWQWSLFTCRSAAVGGLGNLKSSSDAGLVRSLTMSEVASAAFAHRLMALIG